MQKIELYPHYFKPCDASTALFTENGWCKHVIRLYLYIICARFEERKKKKGKHLYLLFFPLPVSFAASSTWAAKAGSVDKFSCPFTPVVDPTPPGTLFHFIAIYIFNNSGAQTGSDTVGALLLKDMTWALPGMEHVNQVRKHTYPHHSHKQPSGIQRYYWFRKRPSSNCTQVTILLLGIFADVH